MPESTVQIKNLQLPYLVNAPDVWGRLKAQPGILTVSVNLKYDFTNDADNLNESIHYGNLAKRIRNHDNSAGNSPAAILNKVVQTVFDMASKTDGANLVTSMVSKLHLPKASKTGDELVFMWFTKFHRTAPISCERKTISVPNMRLMVLIGVNDYEREAKQPVIASLDFDYFDRNTELGEKKFPEEDAYLIERSLAKLIEDSAFETLEALADYAIRELSKSFRQQGYGRPAVRLRLEKPKAIAFADAAVVEHFVSA